MRRPSSWKPALVAACGINCGRCLAFLREKHPCPGCAAIARGDDACEHRRHCVIRDCRGHRHGAWCGSCPDLPCRRLRDLDRRYRKNYATGLIDNLRFIKESGIRAFLRRDKAEGTCRKCGAVLSIHRAGCPVCLARKGVSVLKARPVPKTRPGVNK